MLAVFKALSLRGTQPAAALFEPGLQAKLTVWCDLPTTQQLLHSLRVSPSMGSEKWQTACVLLLMHHTSKPRNPLGRRPLGSQGMHTGLASPRAWLHEGSTSHLCLHKLPALHLFWIQLERPVVPAPEQPAHMQTHLTTTANGSSRCHSCNDANSSCHSHRRVAAALGQVDAAVRPCHVLACRPHHSCSFISAVHLPQCRVSWSAKKKSRQWCSCTPFTPISSSISRSAFAS